MLSPGTNLLAVDDEALVRMFLLGILIESGYSVRTASDGFSALAEIREKIPDLILSDLNMPGMSGFELLSVVRRRFPSIRAIAMSSAFSGAEVPPGVAADAFYEKGAHPSCLLRIMGDITLPERSLRMHPPRQLAPIWIPTNGHNTSGESYVTIACPECLRAFPQVLGENTAVTLETRCVYCANPIQYSIIRSANAVSPPIAA